MIGEHLVWAGQPVTRATNLPRGWCELNWRTADLTSTTGGLCDSVNARESNNREDSTFGTRYRRKPGTSYFMSGVSVVCSVRPSRGVSQQPKERGRIGCWVEIPSSNREIAPSSAKHWEILDLYGASSKIHRLN